MSAVYWTAAVIAYLVSVIVAARYIYRTEQREYPNTEVDPGGVLMMAVIWPASLPIIATLPLFDRIGRIVQRGNRGSHE